MRALAEICTLQSTLNIELWLDVWVVILYSKFSKSLFITFEFPDYKQADRHKKYKSVYVLVHDVTCNVDLNNVTSIPGWH